MNQRPRGGLKGKMPVEPNLAKSSELKFHLSTDLEEAMMPINLVQLNVLPSSLFDSEYLFK